MPVQLSKLQQKMRARLEGAQFRYLNETLYTQSGADSFSMMKQAPELFSAYHAGYRKQVEHWPENPLDVIIGILRREHALEGGGSAGGRSAEPGAKRPRPAVEGPPAAPPATKRRVIADFGCGEARLAATLSPIYNVHSFDLVCPPGNPYITACDMAAVPLASGVADYAVFCLSLMGTDYIKFLMEAHRVLKPGARLIVAEVRSRFVADAAEEGSSSSGAGKPRPSEGAGKGGKGSGPHADRRGGSGGGGAGRPGSEQQRLAGSKRPRAEEEAQGLEDGGEAPQAMSEAALSAFTDAVCALGFKVDDMDESNTMFVLMSFTKEGGSSSTSVAAASASAPAAKSQPSGQQGPHKGKQQHKQQHGGPKPHQHGGGHGSGSSNPAGPRGVSAHVAAPAPANLPRDFGGVSAPALKACKYKRR